jgi:hypothetical protein
LHYCPVLTTPFALQNEGYSIKGDQDIKIKLRFIVANQICSGLKFVNVTKKMVITGEQLEKDPQKSLLACACVTSLSLPRFINFAVNYLSFS